MPYFQLPTQPDDIQIFIFPTNKYCFENQLFSVLRYLSDLQHKKVSTRLYRTGEASCFSNWNSGQNFHWFSRRIHTCISIHLHHLKNFQCRQLLIISSVAKGQLISKCLFEKIVWTKIPPKNLINSALKYCRAESIKFFGGILVQTIFSKRHFEIN